MAKRSLVRTSSSKLITTLLNNPELPSFVARMQAPTLNKLIETVGPEDAGPLIAYTTDRQLRSILDESLWSSLAPGQPEVHRPEEFIRWLFILQEQGEEFLAERLVGLGVDYLVLNFAQLVTINHGEAILTEDYEMLERYAGAAGYAEEFNGYYVTAIHDEEWDITRAALVALQNEYPATLEHVLYLVSRDAGSTAMHDVSGSRRDKKESAGYVTPESATAFLELTRLATLEKLVVGPNLDPVSNRYFSQLGAAAHDDEPDIPDSDDEPSTPPAADPGKQRELEELLIDAEVITDQGTALLLPAPEPDAVLPVKYALDALQAGDPGVFSERLSELIYLSNVLIAGTSLDGKRFDETEAAHAALATCNIGMTYLGEGMGEDQAVRDGLVRLFRIGRQVLLQVPAHVSAMLTTTLRSAEIRDKLFDRQWILTEIDASLDELAGHVANDRLAEAGECLALVSLVLDRPTCDALQALVCEYPRYPLETDLRFIESMNDLEAIDEFMRSLADYAKT